MVLIGLCVGYVFCVAPVSLPGALVPSLEDDVALGWSPVTSGVYLGGVTWAHAVGSLGIGWLSDYLPNVLVLLLYVLAAGILLNVMASSYTASAVIAVHLSVCMLKGVAWPAAMSILGTHLRCLRPELGILMVGLFARVGCFGSNLAVGHLLYYVSWRAAVCSMGITLALAAVVYRLLIRIGGLEKLTQFQWQSAQTRPAREAGIGERETDEAPARVEAAEGAPAEEAPPLYKDGGLWLLLLYASGNEALMNLVVYAGAFAHSVYKVKAADSAILSSFIQLGDALSLGLGILLILAGTSRLNLHRLILANLVLGTVVAVCLVFLPQSLAGFCMLVLIFNFATTLGGYVVVPLYCIEQAKFQGVLDIALRVTLIEGLSSLVGASCKLFVGYRREVSEVGGMEVAVTTALIGSMVAVLVLARVLWCYSDQYLSADRRAPVASNSA